MSKKRLIKTDYLRRKELKSQIKHNEVEKILKNMETQEYLDVLKNRIKE